jgi:hypothetical protein
LFRITYLLESCVHSDTRLFLCVICDPHNRYAGFHLLGLNECGGDKALYCTDATTMMIDGDTQIHVINRKTWITNNFIENNFTGTKYLTNSVHYILCFSEHS